MANSRKIREAAIETLEKDFKAASALYLTDYSRINVEKITRLRRDFRRSGIKFVVVKNTLARKALERMGKPALQPFFKGQIGVAFAASEPTAPARIIRDFQKDNKEFLAIKVGCVGDQLFNQAEVMRLADLPSREVLLSQLLSCLKAPMTNFAGALSGIMTKFVGTLEAVKTQKEAQGS